VYPAGMGHAGGRRPLIGDRVVEFRTCQGAAESISPRNQNLAVREQR
jgi:hypothetical protein